MASATIEIEGLREFQRNLGKINKGAALAVRRGIRSAAKPVAEHVGIVASGEIMNIGPEWNRMRLGNPAGEVYIAPKMRNRGGSPRPNLAGLLMSRAMIPGVREKRAQFVKDVEREFDILARSAGF